MEGGGTQVPIDEANVLVWCSEDHDIDRVRELLHPGIAWVQIDAAGIDHWIDSGVVTPDRIWTCARGIYGAAVAEHAMALLLACCRRIPQLARVPHWAPMDGDLLSDKTVGILGAGGVGTELISRLAAFGSRIVVVSEPGDSVPGADVSLGPAGIPRLLDESDMVVVALPATPYTRRMIGEDELRLLGPDGWLVNVSRGSVVDTDALVRSLQDGAIAGACLDVTDPEPLPHDHPLWKMPNVLITSHSANSFDMSVRAYARLVSDNLVRFRGGHDLLNVVQIDRGY